MKKLSIEEKAKAYDKAIEKTEGLIDFCSDSELKTLKYVFPELKENNENKIRKDLIEWFDEFPDTIWRGNYKKDVIAWLEKQGKQTPDKVEPKFKVGDTVTVKPMSCHGKVFKGKPFKIVDIIEDNYVSDDGKTYSISLQNGWELVKQKPADEPKFKVGDWVVRGKTIAQILDIQEQYYVGLDIDGNDFTSSRFLSDNKIHLWTIKDAKDGDVLVASDKSLFIYNGNINENNNAGFYLAFTEDMNIILDGDNVCGWEEKDSCYPATKEQHDTLMKAIDDAGYTWDAEKKKLKKVIKFKVGDWIINNDVYGDVPVKIKEIGNYLYLCERQDGVIIELNKNAVLKEFKRWDITDARGGDILVGSYGTFIFMGENNGYCGVLSNNTFIRSTGNNEWTECLHPATKEQREQLEKAMTDAGWEFDFEEKELKRVKQNLTWSEEDDRNLSIAIQYVFQHGYLSTVNWLKSLKQRIGR